jgi:tetratricopeptide (TPR) repeat protein
VLEFGVEVAQNDPNELADVANAGLIEEFFLSALDLKQIDWAQVFLRALCQMFPNNIKTMRFLAMYYEGAANTFKAQEIYLEILEGCPEDCSTMKRLISLYRNNDMPNDAISMLNKYLEINQVDEEAWLEMCDMYLAKQNFTKAQFCYEELLLVNPTNYQHNLKYAEILYSNAIASNSSIGTLELARKYFSHALVLIDDINEKRVNNNVARALWGLLKTCKTIKQILNKQDKSDGKNDEVLELAEARIKKIYSQ